MCLLLYACTLTRDVVAPQKKTPLLVGFVPKTWRIGEISKLQQISVSLAKKGDRGASICKSIRSPLVSSILLDLSVNSILDSHP